MKIVYQRVSSASVRIDDKLHSEIGEGAVLFLAVERGDDKQVISWGARKCAELRAFADGERKMNLSLLDISSEALVVSQFTLAARVRKGRRPSFDKAADPAVAEELYEFFCDELRAAGISVKTGVFAAMMDVALVNSGPVTFIIERRNDD
ncbi:MAG TPA: D-aminoacyl-tRNA deacylase [Acidobacteriota bacterium]|nr:D-aminoacyl-tRNA deacylase [Acidobacteriota bacterium]